MDVGDVVGVVSVSVRDGVIIPGIRVHVGALVREGDGWIVIVGVQVAARGMMVDVGVTV